MQGLEDLEASQLIVTLDRLDEDEAPSLKHFLCLKRDFDSGNFVRGRYLNEIISIFFAAPTDLAFSQIDKIAWRKLALILAIRKHTFFDLGVTRDPVALPLKSNLTSYRHSL